MAKLKSEAAQIIAEHIKTLEGLGTKSPYSMAKDWNAFFDDVKTGKKAVSQADVTSSRWNPDDAYYGDDTSESQMFGLSVGSDSVDLGDAKFTREKRWVVGKRVGAYLIDDPHVVDYVLCHVKGYRKYKWGWKAAYYIKGRDVILAGTFLATKDIIDMMKNEIETLINNEVVS